MHQIAASGGGCFDMGGHTAGSGHWNNSPRQQLLQDSLSPVSNKTAMCSDDHNKQHSAFQHPAILPQPVADGSAVSQCTYRQLYDSKAQNSSSSGSPCCSDSPTASNGAVLTGGQPRSSSISSDSSNQPCPTAADSSSSEDPGSAAAAVAAETDREADGCWFERGVDALAFDSPEEGSIIDEGSCSTSDAGSSDTFSDIGDPAATEVVYVREGVGVWPSRTSRILGRLSLVKQHAVLFLAWLPYSATAAALRAGSPPAAAAIGNDGVATCEPDIASGGQESGTGAAGVADDFCDVGQVYAAQQPQQLEEEEAEEDADSPPWGDGSASSAAQTEDASSGTDGEQEHEGQQQLCRLLPVPLAVPRPPPQQQQDHFGSRQPAAAAAHMQAAARQLGSSTSSSFVQQRDSLRSLYAVHPVPLSDIKAFVKHTPPLGCHHVIVVLNSGLTLPPLYFHNGGVREFITTLKQHACLVKAAGNSNSYLVNDTADPLQRCLLALDVADIMLGAPPPGASCVAAPADGPLAAAAAGVWGADADWADEPGWGRPGGSSMSAAAAAAAGTAGLSSSTFASSSRSKLSGAVATAAAAVGSGSAALPHLPWSGFGAGYAGASSYYPAAAFQRALGAGSCTGTASAASAAAQAAGPEDAAARSSFNISSRGAMGTCGRPSALAGIGTTMRPDWGSTLGGVLSSTLSAHLTSTLSKVGQFALEGASTLVAAAMESWHAEAMHHFEHEVDFRPDWGQQGQGTPARTQELFQGPRATPAQRQDSSSYTEKALALPHVQQEPSSASSGVESIPTASAPGRQCPAQAQRQQQLFSTDTAVPAQQASSIPAPSISSQQSSCTDLQLGASAQSAAADVDTSLGPFELLEGAAPDQLSAVRSRAPPPPLSVEELNSFLDSAGVMVDEAGFRERVFQAGIEPSARRKAWKFLLGVHLAGSSTAARQQQRTRQEQQYAALKSQWSSIGPDQAKRWGKWRERRSRIDKDVRRTDRFQPFYRGRGRESARHLTSLRDVLRCYCLFNWDVGYCQGMSDLASPLLVVMDGDEVDAFWSFVGLMERMSGNFSTNQAGMHSQLGALRQLVQVLDPQLHAFFEARDCLNYFFAFRWLLIHFKREFPFEQVLSLWEACWSCPLTPHLHLYLAAAVLIQHRRLLLSNESLDFDGVLRFCVELSGKLDLQGCLRLAEALAVIAGQAGAELLQGLP